eukprot:scaffold201381_cov47-Attheya_sp.AAC.1
MRALEVGNFVAKIVLYVLPRRWSDRIRDNCAEFDVWVYRTGTTRRKPRMTLFEGVGATLLFDLALFGTKNWMISLIIRTFTKFQNSWDTPFSSEQDATHQVLAFCRSLSIPHDEEAWMWEFPPSQYTCLNDFFSRQYNAKYAPPIGTETLVSPACCTVSCYRDNSTLERLLVKGCDYQLNDIGLWPPEDVTSYGQHHVLLGYLSPSDYHRVHAPISGTCVHLALEDEQTRSASVKFFGGKFNLLNKNKRLVVIFEQSSKNINKNGKPLRVALVVIGGVGVDTIVYNSSRNMLGQFVQKGEEVAAFRAGGSAVAMFSNQSLDYDPKFLRACENGPVELLMGESLSKTPPSS